MQQNGYLGNKGFTLNKSELSEQEVSEIKNELTITPFDLNNKNPEKYYIYRESDNKIYLPRYYAERRYGKPKTYKINKGDPINLQFNGTLRENQVEPIETYLRTAGESGGGLLELPCGFGKTSCSLYIIAQLKKKAIIVVQKEFLMNQWIERIQQFLPDARIGKIQGEKIDIENKDIVLAMLQSLSMKEYPDSVFKSFGITVVDEVHHISSKVFSRALFKLVSNYTLGLSATMNRNDGTSFVFKYFLGDVVFKLTTREKRFVQVRCYDFVTKNEEFNNIDVDFRGKPVYSRMISKLSGFLDRHHFILNIVLDLLEENNRQQIMILAHNRNMLEYFYNYLAKLKKSVGYYVGGMKEAALKESESRQIIIATYSMASEALDIKTLTTLIMATPKTSIEQSVGRILRDKHSSPIVVDIVDKHQIYKSQWKKRVDYYKKQDYQISLKKWNDTELKPLFQPAEDSDEDDENPIPKGVCLL
jgi:superfamily II DNA or RNA helicase